MPDEKLSCWLVWLFENLLKIGMVALLQFFILLLLIVGC